MISQKLIGWYKNNKRSLPWRETNDPYFIWLSEVILQQTRVDQGLSYYLRFIRNYPTIKSLAEASEDSVLKDWQGLGYYSRARNLHSAAKHILNVYHGRFPTSYPEIRELKGIGDYTAAAIASIAFGLPHPVIDGNVNRVISRLFAIEEPVDSTIGKKQIKSALDQIFDQSRPADFNQALMEFGALQCKPAKPPCDQCVLQDQCLALHKKLVAHLPRKSKQTAVRNRYFYFLVIQDKQHVYLEKRAGKDIWTGLYQFPLLEVPSPISPTGSRTANHIRKILGQDFSVTNVSEPYRHVLSHQHLFARFIRIKTKPISGKSGWIRVKLSEIDQYAIPRLIHKYLESGNFH